MQLRVSENIEMCRESTEVGESGRSGSSLLFSNRWGLGGFECWVSCYPAVL